MTGPGSMSAIVIDGDLAIRLRRAAFNRALAEADLQAIGPILAPNAILVAGTDSAVISGRKAQVMAWKHEFAAPRPHDLHPNSRLHHHFEDRAYRF